MKHFDYNHASKVPGKLYINIKDYRVLKSLSEREETVIKHRFGIGVEHLTLKNIGKMFGVTRESIRQVEAKAFRKLIHPSRRRWLVMKDPFGKI